jgi:hypothetical protein
MFCHTKGERNLTVHEHRILKIFEFNEGMTRGWKKLHSEELNHL